MVVLDFVDLESECTPTPSPSVDSALACFSCCWKCEFVDCCLQQSHILEWPAGRLRFVSFGPRSTMGVSTWIPPTASRSFRHSSVEPPRGCHAALRSCSLMWTDRSVLRCYIGIRGPCFAHRHSFCPFAQFTSLFVSETQHDREAVGKRGDAFPAPQAKIQRRNWDMTVALRFCPTSYK